MDSRSYWLIAIPTEGGRDKNIVYQEIKSKISSTSNNYADVALFSIPSLKIGTLDALVIQSEELAKLDGTFEGVVNKIADVLKTVLPGQEDKLRDQQKVDGKHIDEMASLDEDVRTKYAAWNQAKGTYTSLQRKQTGNLSQRSLAGMVKEDDFVTNSEYLETMLVAVPKTIQKDWWKKYEMLSKMVVPRSSKKLTEDEDYILVSVTLFKRFAAEFANKCREAKFQPREFTWDAMSGEDEHKEIEMAGSLERKLWGETLRLAKMSFSDAFQAWIHLKAIRVFVESVLRYGLPPDFVSTVVRVREYQ
ncbi:V-type proton ATPase subunit C [Neolecta irregularis DAH-3]|uniref:V-type proton ATPase subunit C n=1 Tax=Neolecta irregularis (strain DAH-3) TaxID=1198029 RepID=A0A1U7LSB8_NEOID|nr:V-type proton ATPase subunit C [Neolecta irregularis DAH-3]|eukprot:OLL25557.1 V-type proton ATPase subunit C [Neolecta irregularis DAH-3]